MSDEPVKSDSSDTSMSSSWDSGSDIMLDSMIPRNYKGSYTRKGDFADQYLEQSREAAHSMTDAGGSPRSVDVVTYTLARSLDTCDADIDSEDEDLDIRSDKLPGLAVSAW
jgi:hypothetical protein